MLVFHIQWVSDNNPLKIIKKSNNNFHKGIQEVYSCKWTFDWHLELKP